MLDLPYSSVSFLLLCSTGLLGMFPVVEGKDSPIYPRVFRPIDLI